MSGPLLCLYFTVSFVNGGRAKMAEKQTARHEQDIFSSFARASKIPIPSSFKKSYLSSFYSPMSYQSSYQSKGVYSPMSYQSSYPSSYPSYYSYSYPSPAPSPYPYSSYGNSHPAGYPGQLGQSNCISLTAAGTTTRNRSETFEIKGKAFKSIGCWSDNSVRAMETLERKHRLLKDQDYKSRVNALMKCAEAAHDSNLQIFALQNGGQCFGGENAEKTFRKYGPSTACCGDGEGGPWSNEVYSFLGSDGKPLVNASYNPWSSWSPCQQTCNNGNNTAVQMRNRTCFNATQTTYVTSELGCGNLGSTLIETRPCVVQTCPGNTSTSTTVQPNTTSQPPTQQRPSVSTILPSSSASTIPPSGSPSTISPRGPAQQISKTTSVCTAKVDLGFLIDGSGSIEQSGTGNFQKELDFVKLIISGFKVSKEDTHVGVIIFSSDASVVSGFDQHHDKSSIIAAIDGIQYPSRGTNIGKALDLARTSLYGNSARSGIPNMLIVLTDGQSFDRISEPAQKLRDSGVTIFAVGLGGNYDLDQLNDMATDPDSQHVYKADFNDFNNVVQSIKDRACTGSGGVQQSSQKDPVIPIPLTVCKARVDLAILIDGSQSIDYFGAGNFKRCLSFVQNLVSGFNIAKEGTHVGIVVFSANAKVVFGFEKYFNIQAMIKAIDRIDYPQKGTHTGKALDMVRDKLIDASARQGVPNILLVMTDGASQDEVDKPSKKLRDMGVTIFSLGIGKEFDINQLNDMATDPDRDHVFTAEFSELGSPIIERIKSKACKGSGGVLMPKGDYDKFGSSNVNMIDNDKYKGEIIGGEGMTDQWGSDKEEQAAFENALQGEFHGEDSNGLGKKQNGRGFGDEKETYDGETGDAKAGKEGLFGVATRPRQIKGRLFLPDGKIKRRPFVLTEGGSRVKSGVFDGQIKQLENDISGIRTNDLRNRVFKRVTTNKGLFSFMGPTMTTGGATQAESRSLRENEFPEPVALYPLNAKYQAKDVIGGNTPGITNNVVPAAGPFNQSENSLLFSGTPDSYIELPNNGNLDTKNSMSLLAWILPQSGGPIFNYKTDGWGVNFWMARPRKLFARFVDRNQREILPAVKSTHVKPNKWNFVGTTYDQNSGQASLWINGKKEDERHVGNITLSTNYPVRMGSRIGDNRNFRGRISCMQVYNVALSRRQMRRAKLICRSLESN